LKVDIMKIELMKGDITRLEVDAIVNPANSKLVMGGGVSAALHAIGGEEIEKEAVKKAPIGLGEAMVTNAGKLRAKFVIHAATMHLGGTSNEKIISECTTNSLKRADRLELRTIALPALGCGIGRFPVEKGAKIILTGILDYQPKFLEVAIVVLHNDLDFEIFKKTYEGLKK